MKILINTLERQIDTGFVATVHWSISKAAGGHTASQYGTESFTHTEGDLIPYEQLTPEIVTGWLKERWGAEVVAEKEAALDAQLTALANPPTQSGLPWAAQEPGLLKNP